MFSNTLTELNHLPAIQEACAEADLSLDTVGLGTGTARSDPETILGEYDVVFAKGRAALEALATGCAVILADISGFGEMVTTENYDLLRLRNFGLRTFVLPPVKETILSQLKRYDPEDAAKVTERVRRSEGLRAATLALVEIYEAAIKEFRQSPPPAGCHPDRRRPVPGPDCSDQQHLPSRSAACAARTVGNPGRGQAPVPS